MKISTNQKIGFKAIVAKQIHYCCPEFSIDSIYKELKYSSSIEKGHISLPCFRLSLKTFSPSVGTLSKESS